MSCANEYEESGEYKTEKLSLGKEKTGAAKLSSSDVEINNYANGHMVSRNEDSQLVKTELERIENEEGNKRRVAEEERHKWAKWEREEREKTEVEIRRYETEEKQRSQKKMDEEKRREEIKKRIKQLNQTLEKRKLDRGNKNRGVKRKKEETEEKRKKRKIEIGRGIKRKQEEERFEEGEIRRVKLRKKEVVIRKNE